MGACAPPVWRVNSAPPISIDVPHVNVCVDVVGGEEDLTKVADDSDGTVAQSLERRGYGGNFGPMTPCADKAHCGVPQLYSRACI